MNPQRTALLTIDLQNDFLHPEGAYGRAGQSAPEIAALPARIAPLRDALVAAGGTYISAHLKKLRPFLTKGDFSLGGFGHDLVDTLKPADFTIEKVAYSAFYQTRLEYILCAMGIDTLLVGGIVTNGGVASTLRDAHLRDIHTVMLSDGCAAFKTDVHEASLLSLGSVTRILTCAEATDEIGAAP